MIIARYKTVVASGSTTPKAKAIDNDIILNSTLTYLNLSIICNVIHNTIYIIIKQGTISTSFY